MIMLKVKLKNKLFKHYTPKFPRQLAGAEGAY